MTKTVAQYKEPPLTDEEILEIRKKYNIVPARERLFEEREKKPKGKRDLTGVKEFHQKRYGKLNACLYKNCKVKCVQNKKFCARHLRQFITSVANGRRKLKKDTKL